MRSDNGLGFLDLSVGGTGDSVELDSTDGDEGATGEDGMSRANDDIAGIGGNSGRPCRELDEAPSAVFGGGDGGEPPSCRGVLARGSIVYAAVITSTDHSRRSSRLQVIEILDVRNPCTQQRREFPIDAPDCGPKKKINKTFTAFNAAT